MAQLDLLVGETHGIRTRMTSPRAERRLSPRAASGSHVFRSSSTGSAQRCSMTWPRINTTRNQKGAGGQITVRGSSSERGSPREQAGETDRAVGLVGGTGGQDLAVKISRGDADRGEPEPDRPPKQPHREVAVFWRSVTLLASQRVFLPPSSARRRVPRPTAQPKLA